MRFWVSLLAICPTLALADTFVLNAPVRDVILYPGGGAVTRVAQLDAPAGQHRLIVRDLPQTTMLETLRISIDNAVLGEMTLRDDYVPPRDTVPSPEVAAAEAAVKDAQDRVLSVRDRIALAEAEAAAAEARERFLTTLAPGESPTGIGTDDLRDMARMVGEEVLDARKAALAARIEARRITQELDPLEEALDKARQALAALVPEDTARAFVSVAVTLAEPVNGPVTLRYQLEPDMAGWQPAYDMRLERGDAPEVAIDRGAYVWQQTGEHWQDVNLRLSTLLPGGEIAPGYLPSEQRRIGDPAPPPAPVARFSDGAMAESQAEPVPMAEKASATQIEGLGVEYSYPSPVSVASGAEAVRVSLGRLSVPAKLRAEAIPLLHGTAFLVAQITNDTGELILPSAHVSYFVDGTLVGQASGAAISAGAEAELPFGPIDGVRVTRRTLEGNEGDRGLIRRSNERSASYRITIENLTGLDWTLRVLDRVPYSEQEDLTINWHADPAPDRIAPDDRRGILEWNLPLDAGETREIRLDETLTWPADKVLR